MFKSSFHDSVIGRRFIFYTLIFSSCVALLFTLIQVEREFVREQEKYLHFEKIIEDSLLDSLSKSIWSYDDSQIYSQLQGISNLPTVQRVFLSLPDNVQFSVGDISADYIQTKEFTVTHTSYNVTQKMGDLTVYSSLDERYMYLLEYAGMILATNISKTLFVVIFMFFLFDLLVTRHLLQISTELANYNQGDKPIRIKLSRKVPDTKDELELVVESINNLQQRVFIEQCKVNNESTQKDILHSKVIEQKEKLIELERNIGLNEFALGLRVEIRKPLFKLKTFCESLYRDINTIPYNRLEANNAIDNISTNVHWALEIIDRSNDLFKYNEPNCALVDVNQSIARILELLSHNTEANKVTVKHQTLSRQVMVFVDEKHLDQVLISVIRNAIESLALCKISDRQIELSAFTVDNTVAIHIEDNGVGVPSQQLEKLFLPYYSTKESGLGIGLSISKNLLHEMNGTITAQKNTSGLTMVIELPSEKKTTLN